MIEFNNKWPLSRDRAGKDIYNLNETVSPPIFTTKISLMILLELHTSQGNMTQDTDEEEINHSTVTTQGSDGR